MSYYFRNGNTFKQAAEQAVDLYKELPVGTYTIKADPMSGALYFEVVEDLSIPNKRYGDLDKDARRIIETFQDRTSSTGVLLAGEKGSGKTLLAKTLSVFLREENVITIVINTNLCGESFNTFIQGLQQPAMILFDEFEKTYDNEEQEAILTLLDGVYPTKKLFVLTCNNRFRINEHMRNRPGRLFYALEYEGLEREFVIEYAQENLNDKDKIDGILSLLTLYSKFNFDMLKSLIEEMNRYNETAQEAVRILNIKPDTTAARFKVKLVPANTAINPAWVRKQWAGNPLGMIAITAESPDEEHYEEFYFTNLNLVKLDGAEGKFSYKNEDGDLLELERIKEETFDYTKFL